MIRKQFFIREDQNEELKALTRKLGVSEAELIRESIDMIIEDKSTAMEDEKDNWKEGLLQAAGIWEDRDDLDELSRDFRQSWNKRIDKLATTTKDDSQ